MRALLNTNTKTTFNPKARKEVLSTAYKILDSNFNTVVDCRTYWPNSVCTAAIWVHGNKFQTSGTGKAGGGGYRVESAAIDDAIDSAGIELYGTPYADGRDENLKKRTNISGVGETAIERALLAIAKSSSSKRKFHLVKCFA